MAELPVGWLGLDVDHWLKLISLAGTAFVWWLGNRRKPRLEAFFTHGASHAVQGANIIVNTHGLLVRNVGALPATNVRITHTFWPQHTDVKLWPAMPYTTQAVPVAGHEIVIERLRPKEQISVAYLYFHPTMMDHFGTRVAHDTGFGTFIQWQHARTLPRWAYALVIYLMLAGLAFSLYIVLKVLLFAFVVA
jgi:hypothetical protein